MRKLLLAVILGLIGVIGFAQTVNDVPLKEIDVEYIQIVGTGNFTKTKVKIDIDFGQLDNYWDNKDKRIMDENNKPVIFNSMIDALNFMNKNGYDFVTAYAVTMGNQNVYHYLMKKKKE